MGKNIPSSNDKWWIFQPRLMEGGTRQTLVDLFIVWVTEEISCQEEWVLWVFLNMGHSTRKSNALSSSVQICYLRTTRLSSIFRHTHILIHNWHTKQDITERINKNPLFSPGLAPLWRWLGRTCTPAPCARRAIRSIQKVRRFWRKTRGICVVN